VQCPKCSEDCDRDEVDVAVGVIYGPWGCYCGWSEDSRYDRSDGPSPAQLENPDWYVDSCGGMKRLEGIQRNLERLGLDGKLIVDEVFRDVEQEGDHLDC
jgi:hypothetical protein